MLAAPVTASAMHFYAPAMIMAEHQVLPLSSVRPFFTYLRIYVRTYERTSRRRPLSKSNTFDQSCMKLGHIV